MTNPYFIEPFVDTGLGNSAYLVGSHDSRGAVLIDPLRDVDQYLAAAERLGVTITHVLDTHVHADFVSGARELAARAGAVMGASAAAGMGFDHRKLAEGDVLSLGGFNLRILETPGHTPEHISFLVDPVEANGQAALFSGGALIVGGAARTDLLGHELSEPLARQLYHSIHHKLMVLPDEVGVYPTHGAGSFCIAPASSERTTTIGRERNANPLTAPQSEDDFVRRALTGLPSYPAYYKHMRAVNIRGPRLLGGLPVLKPLAAAEVKALMTEGALVLDVRPNADFGAGHIPESYGIRVNAPLTTWAGWLVPFGARLVLVSNSIEERMDAIRQLIRIGYDDLLGYLEDGIAGWAKAGYQVDTVPGLSVTELRDRLQQKDDLILLDVRQKSEWDAGHIPGARHIEAGRIPYDELPFDKNALIAVQCASGNRSMSAIAVMRRLGYRNLIQVEGGINRWMKMRYEIQR